MLRAIQIIAAMIMAASITFLVTNYYHREALPIECAKYGKTLAVDAKDLFNKVIKK